MGFHNALYDVCPGAGQVTVGGSIVTPTFLLAFAVAASLLLLVGGVVLVSVLAVVLEADEQGDTGVRVLAELRQMLRDLLNVIRRGGTGDDT
jgi:hypothetical protein